MINIHIHIHLVDPLGRGTSESYFTTLSSVSVCLMGRLYYQPPRIAEMRTRTQITQRSTWYKGVGSSLYSLILLFHHIECKSPIQWLWPLSINLNNAGPNAHRCFESGHEGGWSVSTEAFTLMHSVERDFLIKLDFQLAFQVWNLEFTLQKWNPF